MRAAYTRYSGERGYTEAEFIALVGEVAGQDLSGWFAQVVQTPGEWDYQPALDWFGLEFEAPKAAAKSDPNAPDADEPDDAPTGWLGARTETRDGLLVVTTVPSDTPAATAGLSVDDEIVAVNGWRVGPKDFTRILGQHGAGSTVELEIVRQGRLITVPATLETEPTATWQLKFSPNATDEQKARVDAWLGVKN